MVLVRSILLVLIAPLMMAFLPIDKKIDKKVDKCLTSIWPEDALAKQIITSEHLVGAEVAYTIRTGEVLLGYCIVDKAKSKFDVFDFMVVFDPEGNILQPAVLIYREDYGAEICSKRWLKQFIGMDAGSDMRLGQEVQNISGATISCEAASRGFKIASERIKAIIDG